MTTGRDDDALSWGGDDDPTLDVGRSPEAAERTTSSVPPADPPALPDGYTALGKGSEDVGRIAADGTVVAPSEPRPLSNTMLVTLGILGGVYLLFTVGWIVGGLRLQGTAQFLVSPVGYTVALWLAVAAPAIWFLTVFLLTRLSRAWIRVVWLIGGLALLVPWPFILVGAIGR